MPRPIRRHRRNRAGRTSVPRPNAARLRTFGNRALRRSRPRASGVSPAAYDARDLTHEFKKRLAGEHTPEQDAERVRLAGKHAGMESWLNDADRTLAELEAFDATEDSRWA